MKISIITITYKDLDGLKKTIKSVVDQTFEDYECLVIDGDSGPDVVEFLNDVKNGKIKSISEKDGGIFDAMNKGLERACGDWIVFMNGGDTFYSPETLSCVSNFLVDAHDIVYGDCLLEFDDGHAKLKRARHHRYIYYGMFASHQSMFFRRDFVGNHRFSVKFRVGGDYAFVAEMIRQRANCLKVGACLSRFDMSGISNNQQGKGRLENWIVQRDILQVPLLVRFCIRSSYIVSASIKKIINKLR